MSRSPPSTITWRPIPGASPFDLVLLTRHTPAATLIRSIFRPGMPLSDRLDSRYQLQLLYSVFVAHVGIARVVTGCIVDLATVSCGVGPIPRCLVLVSIPIGSADMRTP